MVVHYWSKGQVWGTTLSYDSEGGVLPPPPIPIMHGSDVALRRVKIKKTQVFANIRRFSICPIPPLSKNGIIRLLAIICSLRIKQNVNVGISEKGDTGLSKTHPLMFDIFIVQIYFFYAVVREL